MDWKRAANLVTAGLLGGFVGEGILGALFSAPPLRAVLYDPRWQSPLFIDLTPSRNIPISVVGLVILSVVHAWFFELFKPSIPGRTWVRKGLFWGFAIWMLYWVFQEWFMFNQLLREPVLLSLLELTVLLAGSMAEGLVIAFLLGRKDFPSRA